MIRHPHIHLDIDEGIDRKELARLRGRFLSLNQTRLQRASSALSTRQQLVLRLLPLLFHVNHPLLPGYVSASTPAGLSGFEPDDDLLAEAQRLTRSFSYKPRRGNPPQPIQALFLMGSLGTVAQAEQSDLDLWVCHSPDLSAAEVAELQRKCQQLEVWATGQGAELHCFLINPGTFSREDREARLTSDDCGTTQHYLLLDEFYRTAIWLGGRTPLWWLVPVKDEARYAEFTQALLSKRFVRADEVIDLGHLAHIPPSEFIGAGMWQLFKGIHSPFKSVLKLLLTEVYASEYPNTRCLSLRFKEAVFANQLDADELDPYMVIYRRLEEYLSQRGEQERLELVRRCLYLKVGKKLSKPPRNRKKSWQRLLLERLTADWHWDQRQWERLDARDSWKVRQVQSERRALVNELTYTYRFLAQFARQLQVSSPLSGRDMGILGRRLYAAFERKAGKVEFINPGIAPDLAEELLSLVQCPSSEDDQEQQWALFAGSLAGSEWQDHSPLKRSRHLIELLAWAQRNGVIDNSSRIAIQPGESDLNDFELSNLLGSLQHSFALPLPEVDDQALLEPSRPSEVLLLVNVGLDPLRQHSQQNIHMTSERTDSLGYAGLRENLVLSLDQVCLNSWNELLVSRYDNDNALLDSLRDYLNALPASGPAPRLQVRCFCRNRAPAIARRVEELFQEVIACQSSGRSRFLLQIQQRFYLFDLTPGQVSYQAVNGIAALISLLGEEQSDFSPLALDRHALEGEDLALILPQGRPGCVQVFYRRDGDEAELHVLDERNALWRQRLPFRDEQSLLTPLQRFLSSVQQRQSALKSLSDLPGHPLELRYYELLPPLPGRAQTLERRGAPQQAERQPYYPVQAIIEQSAGGRRHVSLYCNHREFSELEYGAGLFPAVARHILAQREGGQRYPCYITDLDLSATPGGAAVETLHYLRCKAELELALNQALQEA